MSEGIRIVRLSGGRGKVRRPVESSLPVITEEELAGAVAATRVKPKPVEEPVPPGYISVYEVKDLLGCHGGGGERLLRKLVLAGKVKRTTVRRFGIDGCVKHCAYYALSSDFQARSSISRTPGSQPEKRGATPLRATTSVVKAWQKSKSRG